MSHKFGTGGPEQWKDEPASLGPHQLDAWRKKAQAGQTFRAIPGIRGAWHEPTKDGEGPQWMAWHKYNRAADADKAGPKRHTLFKAAQGEKPDTRWPGVTPTDPFGDISNSEIAKRLAVRKGSRDVGQGTYRGPGDTVAPKSKPSPVTPKTPEKEIDPETDRMSHADKFDPEKQRQQQLDRVSDVMRQRKDVKANLNFSDLKGPPNIRTLANPKNVRARQAYGNPTVGSQMARSYRQYGDDQRLYKEIMDVLKGDKEGQEKAKKYFGSTPDSEK